MYVAPAHFERAFSVTEEGKIMSWKQATEKFLGYLAAEADRNTCRDLGRQEQTPCGASGASIGEVVHKVGIQPTERLSARSARAAD